MNPWGFEEYLSERSLAKTTIKYKIRLIRYLEIRFNLWDSEAIGEHIKKLDSSKRRKNK